MKRFFLLIKHIFGEIRLPFRHFVHWNITKLINELMGYIVGIIFSAPFVIVCIFYVMFVFPEIRFGDIFMKIISMNISQDDFAGIFDKNGFTMMLSFLIFLIFIIFNFGKTYSYVLNLLMYKHYFHEKKIEYKKNFLIHIPTIKKYIQLFLLHSLILSIPFLVFIIAFALLIFGIGGLETAILSVRSAGMGGGWVGISLFVIFVGCFASFAYINFRIIFSVLFFVESDEFGHHQKTKASEWIKKSLGATSGGEKIFLFLIIFVIFGIITLPFTFQNKKVEDNIQNGTRYVQLVQIASMTGITLPPEQADELDELSQEFRGKTGQEIIDFIDTNSIQKILLVLFYFFLIKGISELLMYAYFYHVLLQKHKTHD